MRKSKTEKPLPGRAYGQEKASQVRPNRMLIADLDAFAGLSGDELDYVLNHARMRRFQKNEIVFQQGSRADAFYVLLDGHLKIFQTTPEGQQVVLRFAVPGEIFGFAAAIGLHEYPGTAIAVAESVALAWDQALWHPLVQRSPVIAKNVLRTVGSRLIEQQARVREMSTQKAERRVACGLLRFVKEAGNATEEGVEIAFPVSRQDLAELTGSTLYTVSRVMSVWEKSGVIQSGRQHIVVRDPEALAAIAENGVSAPGEE